MSPEAMIPWTLFIVMIPALVITCILLFSAINANYTLKKLVAMQETELAMIKKQLYETTALSEARRIRLIDADREINQCRRYFGSQS